jgi:hypothetical protein
LSSFSQATSHYRGRHYSIIAKHSAIEKMLTGNGLRILLQDSETADNLYYSLGKRPRRDSTDPDKGQSRPRKRSRHDPPNGSRRSSVNTRNQSRRSSLTSSSGTGPEKWYGVGDDDAALYNIFETFQEARFTTIPRPHGSQGLDEPWWNLHRDSKTFLTNNFLTPG